MTPIMKMLARFVAQAAKPLNAPLIDYLVETQRQKEQTIDTIV